MSVIFASAADSDLSARVEDFNILILYLGCLGGANTPTTQGSGVCTRAPTRSGRVQEGGGGGDGLWYVFFKILSNIIVNCAGTADLTILSV